MKGNAMMRTSLLAAALLFASSAAQTAELKVLSGNGASAGYIILVNSDFDRGASRAFGGTRYGQRRNRRFGFGGRLCD